MRKQVLAALLGCVPLLFEGTARANLNIFAGSHLGADERGRLVIEWTAPVIAEVGPFFSWSRNVASGSENRYDVGLVGRMTLPWLNFFADLRGGYGWNSTPTDRPGGGGFNLELGTGYRFSLPAVDLLPRVGLNAVTANSDVPSFNLSIGVAVPL